MLISGQLGKHKETNHRQQCESTTRLCYYLFFFVTIRLIIFFSMTKSESFSTYFSPCECCWATIDVNLLLDEQIIFILILGILPSSVLNSPFKKTQNSKAVLLVWRKILLGIYGMTKNKNSSFEMRP